MANLKDTDDPEHHSNAVWKDAIPYTTGSFEKFVSNELLIARTIMNRDSLSSLSKDQQQRIMRIRNGVNPGRIEHGPTPSYEVRSEQKLVSNTGVGTQHLSSDDTPTKVFPGGIRTPDTPTDIRYDSNDPGSIPSSVDRIEVCENELQDQELHTKHQEIHTSLTQHPGKSNGISSSQYGISGHSLQMYNQGSKWKCHNAKKEDSYRKIYDEKKMRKIVEPFPKPVLKCSLDFGYLNHHLKSLTIGKKQSSYGKYGTDQQSSPTLKLPCLLRSNGLPPSKKSCISQGPLQNIPKLAQWKENGGGRKKLQRRLPPNQYSLLSRSWPQTSQDYDMSGSHSRGVHRQQGNLTYHLH